MNEAKKSCPRRQPFWKKREYNNLNYKEMCVPGTCGAQGYPVFVIKLTYFYPIKVLLNLEDFCMEGKYLINISTP